MADIITLHPPGGTVAVRYHEVASYTAKSDDPDDSEFRVVLASEDGRPDVVHVILLGDGCIEVLETFRDTEAGRAAAKMVGEAVDKALFFSVFYGRED